MKTTASKKIDGAKTNLDEVLKNASAKLKTVKEDSNILKFKNGDFRPVPGFTDYGVNSSFTQLVSKKTGKAQQIPAGKKKYLIFNDKCDRKSIGMEEIKLLLPVAAKKNKVVTGEDKGPSKREIILALHAKGKAPKEIESETGFKYNTIYECIYKHTILSLNAAGKTPKQIHAETGYSMGTINRQIDKYAKKSK